MSVVAVTNGHADHHFGNRAASTRIEDLMEHMSINVEWKSNFQKLAEPQNQELQTAFRKGKLSKLEQAKEPRVRRRDDWNGMLRYKCAWRQYCQVSS